jgi:CRP-like cAMP-binding protein
VCCFYFTLSFSFSQVFICIENCKLLFSEPLHASTSDSAFLSNNIVGKSCFGYINLTPKSEVVIRYEKGTASLGSGSIQRYGFRIQENGEEIQLSLFAESESDRRMWMEVINEAINGVQHELETKALMIPSFSTQTFGPLSENSSMTTSAIDFPHKEGFLKKTSTGKTLGIKSVKKRYFRVEAGELRYYEDEDIRPSKLHDVFSLNEAELVHETVDNSLSVAIQFPNGGRLMKLEAPTAQVAQDWREVIQETIDIFSQNKTIYSSEFKKNRRFNVYDQITEEEKKVIRANPSLVNNTSNKSQNSTSVSPPPPPPPDTIASNSPKRTSFFGGNSTTSTITANSPPASPSSPSPVGRSRNSLLSSTLNNYTAETGSGSSSSQIIKRSHFKSPKLIELLKPCLQQHFLLKEIENINLLLDCLEEKFSTPGEVVIWQGSIGDLFYIIEKGKCEVVKNNNQIAVLSEGKSFGEMALLNSTVRTATVRSLQPCHFWILHRRAFRDLIAKQEKLKLQDKIQFLKTIELFSKLVDSSLEKIADVMVQRTFPNGEKIIKQGEQGDSFFMIISGRVVVTQQQSNFATSPKAVELVRLGPGKYFGELALLEDAPRKATVTATTAATCWVIDRKSFLSLFGSMNAAVTESVGIKMLKNVKLLQGLSDRHLLSVAKCLENKNFVEGEVIIRQGDVGDCFYMISSGEVSVQVNHIQVAVLESGSFFGEMSLLSNEKRSATIIALKDTTCLVLSRSNFIEHLGPLDEVIKAESDRRSQMLSMRRRSSSASGEGIMMKLRTMSGIFSGPSTSPTQTRSKSLRSSSLFASTQHLFSVNNLEKIRKIGFGTFGIIYLVQQTEADKFYAMKEIRKEHLFSTDQEKYVYSEKENLLMLLNDDTVNFFPALYSTFSDSKSIYYVQQHIHGEDMWKLLYSNKLTKTKFGGIPIKQAEFYAANLLAIIDYLHEHDVVHRDLKPENLVLNESRIFLQIIFCFVFFI